MAFAHSLASEAVMRALAGHLGHDPEKWGLAGLLHDLGYPGQQVFSPHTCGRGADTPGWL